MTKAEKIFKDTYYECRKHIRDWGIERNPDGRPVAYGSLITELVVSIRTCRSCAFASFVCVSVAIIRHALTNVNPLFVSLLQNVLDRRRFRCYNVWHERKGLISVNERIKALRKHFKLTQDGFAARLGIKRGAVANYEIGRNIPADSVVALICREFHVREEWLRNGTEPMFASAPASLDALAEAENLSRGERILIEKLIGLKPEVRQGILDYIVEVAAAIGSESVPVPEPPEPPAPTPEELHAELDRQLGEEKEAGERSVV